MRINVAVGDKQFRIGCGDGTKLVGWLQAEIIKRHHQHSGGEKLLILELRTPSNQLLDTGDQIFDILKDNDTVMVILKQASDSVRSGDMFQGRYFVTRKLAEGTYGEVFVARDLNLDREVAVKVLKRSKLNETNIKRFMREARLTARLSQHPNIVSIYDFGRTENGVFYLVMALLLGQCMDEWLEERIRVQRPLSEIECLHLFMGIADGLDAAHSHVPPIIHRDLKPDNIFLCRVSSTSTSAFVSSTQIDVAVSNSTTTADILSTPSGTPPISLAQMPIPTDIVPLPNNEAVQAQAAMVAIVKNSRKREISLEVTDYVPKIMDFGIAVLDSDDAKKKTLACGTRMFASPEQTQSAISIDCRSDIWSLGVMMFQCVSLMPEMPFDPIAILLKKDIGGHVPDIGLHTLTPLSPHFHNLITRCLQVSPDDRFQSVGDLRTYMKELLDWNHRHRAQTEPSRVPSFLSSIQLAPKSALAVIAINKSNEKTGTTTNIMLDYQVKMASKL